MSVKFSRWWIVVAAILVMMCLGTLYAWSIFVLPLELDFGGTKAELALTFTIASVTFALVMIGAGRLQDRIGPRIVCTAGGVLVGLGLVLASFTPSLVWLYLTYGLIYGAGIGFCYISSLAAGLKWFPDKRGLVGGLIVGGFGSGPLIFAPLGVHIMGPEMDWSRVFLIMGVLFLVIIMTVSQLLRNPPAGWKPKGWEPSSLKAQVRDFSPREMLKTSEFWRLWIAYGLGTTVGLMVIGHLKPFGMESGLSAAAAAIAVGILGIANGAGRPVWGFILDRIGMRKTLLLIYTIQGVFMFFFTGLGYPLIVLIIASSIVGFNYGGKLGIFPALTAHYFGTKHLGMNYSLVFTAWGVGATIGPILGGTVFDMTGEYMWAFISAGLLCLTGGMIGVAAGKAGPQPVS